MEGLIGTILGILILTGLVALAKWGDIKIKEKKGRNNNNKTKE